MNQLSRCAAVLLVACLSATSACANGSGVPGASTGAEAPEAGGGADAASAMGPSPVTTASDGGESPSDGGQDGEIPHGPDAGAGTADAATAGDAADGSLDSLAAGDSSVGGDSAGSGADSGSTFDSGGDSGAVDSGGTDATTTEAAALGACGICDRVWVCNGFADMWVSSGPQDCADVRGGTTVAQLYCAQADTINYADPNNNDGTWAVTPSGLALYYNSLEGTMEIDCVPGP